jgi:flagellar biosynthesis/type III secretory pathway ATPase
VATKKYRLQPVLGAREQAKREAERVLAARTKQAAYEAQRDLILIGAYKKGTDPRTDLAIAKTDSMNAFLRQGTNEKAPPANTLAQLQKMF